MRTERYRATGAALVELVCGACDKKEWVPAYFTDGSEEVFWQALKSGGESGWQTTDDDIVCSDECANAWWAAL